MQGPKSKARLTEPSGTCVSKKAQHPMWMARAMVCIDRACRGEACPDMEGGRRRLVLSPFNYTTEAGLPLDQVVQEAQPAAQAAGKQLRGRPICQHWAHISYKKPRAHHTTPMMTIRKRSSPCLSASSPQIKLSRCCCSRKTSRNEQNHFQKLPKPGRTEAAT